jgi:TonB family protein
MSLLADATIRASIVLLIGLLLRAALRRRSPALRHAVLAATIVAAPFVGVLGRLLPAVTLPAADAAPMATAAIAPGPAHAVATRVEGATAGVELATGRLPSAADEPARWPAVTVAAAVALWGVGAVLASTILLGAAIRLRQVAARGVETGDPRWRRALEAACHAAGVARPVRLLVTPDAALLATWGWRRPRILIPAGALEWSDERIHTVLAHEIAHVRRGDWMLQSFAEGLRALLWWNPAAWIACRALRDDSELACDDAVLQSGVGATAYAEHLLKIAQSARPAWPAAVVMPMARHSTLERRIVAMLNPNLDRRSPTRLALIGTAAALLLLLLPVAVLRAAQAGRQPLEGVIYDPTGAVLPGVAVTLDAGPAKVEATSDASGHFVFAAVDPGPHLLEAKVPGFRPLRQPLELRQRSDWNRAITLQVGDLKETVSVRDRRPSAPTPIAAAGSGPTAVRVGGNIRAPRKIVDIKPLYPERMRDAGLEGKVPIEALIGVDGRVASVRVATAQVHPDFALAAVEAVRQWQFEPTLLNGVPVEVVMTVTVDFSLE